MKKPKIWLVARNTGSFYNVELVKGRGIYPMPIGRGNTRRSAAQTAIRRLKRLVTEVEKMLEKS